jgi:hypothetical protein
MFYSCIADSLLGISAMADWLSGTYASYSDMGKMLKDYGIEISDCSSSIGSYGWGSIIGLTFGA